MANRAREIRELSIRNVGVIEEATLSFGAGFNVITGETGAGKTMVLTGLNLLSGNRSDVDLIRDNSEKLTVSATVAMNEKPEGSLAELIIEQDPEMQDDELLLQRSITKDGKSRAMVGGSPTTIGLLGSFSSEFFVIHGQSANQKISDRAYQLDLLDRSSSEIGSALNAFQEIYDRWREKSKELTEFEKALNDKEREVAEISKFLADFDRLRPIAGEWSDLEERIRRLDSVEELRLSLSVALNAIDGENQGAINQVSSAVRGMEQYREPDSSFDDITSRLKSIQIDLREIVTELSHQLNELDVDPSDLDRMRERKAHLRQFLQRYGKAISSADSEADALEELIRIVPEKRSLLEALEASDDQVERLRSELDSLEEAMKRSAKDLSTARSKAAIDLAKRINIELAGLGLEKSLFAIEVKEAKDYSRHGRDEIDFLFTSHSGGKLLPLYKGASGGELSRVMLATELVFAEQREVGTLIFDEVDAGIGGETGLIIGERIARLAKHFQIVVITHLAQVAVWADRHFKIEKTDSGDVVSSSVITIDGVDRVSEIARMLSGQSDLEAAQLHAKELLKHAGK